MGNFSIFLVCLLGFSCSLTNGWDKLMENPAYFEGDIQLNKEQAKILNSPNLFGLSKKDGFNNHWPKGVPIAYEYSDQFKNNFYKTQKIEAALKDYENKTCLRFVKRTNQTKYIRFVPGGGCSSMVGMQYSGNYITLHDGCFRHGTILHEIAHSLGVWHEQARGDRDKYINIIYKNMKCCKSQFANRGSYIDSLGFPYDFESMMHYPAWAFSNGNGPTIEPKDKTKRIGQRRGFSKIDIQQLNAMYCDDSRTTTTKPTTAPATTPTPVTTPTTPTAASTSSPIGSIFRQGSSQKCLGLNKDSELIFTGECDTRFLLSGDRLFLAKDMSCGEPTSTRSDSTIVFKRNCNATFKKSDNSAKYFTLKHGETGKCIHPKRGSSNPVSGTKAVIHHSCGSGKRIEFTETSS